MEDIWFEFKCFLAEFLFFVTHNSFNIFRFHKAKFLKNQKVRFVDEFNDIKSGIIKEVIREDGEIYYNVVVYDSICKITQNQIIHAV